MTIPKGAMSKRVYGRLSTDPERLRLLEAVAEASKAEARRASSLMGDEGMAFAEYISKHGRGHCNTFRAMLEALTALEAYDGHHSD